MQENCVFYRTVIVFRRKTEVDIKRNIRRKGVVFMENVVERGLEINLFPL